MDLPISQIYIGLKFPLMPNGKKIVYYINLKENNIWEVSE